MNTITHGTVRAARAIGGLLYWLVMCVLAFATGFAIPYLLADLFH